MCRFLFASRDKFTCGFPFPMRCQYLNNWQYISAARMTLKLIIIYENMPYEMDVIHRTSICHFVCVISWSIYYLLKQRWSNSHHWGPINLQYLHKIMYSCLEETVGVISLLYQMMKSKHSIEQLGIRTNRSGEFSATPIDNGAFCELINRKTKNRFANWTIVAHKSSWLQRKWESASCKWFVRSCPPLFYLATTIYALWDKTRNCFQRLVNKDNCPSK